MGVYNDTFIEESVYRKTSAAQKAGFMTACVLCALCVLLAFVGLIFMLVPAILFGILIFYLYRNTELDFDYTYVNGSLSFAKVMHKQMRKSLFSIEAGDILAMGPENVSAIARYNNPDQPKLTTYDFSAQSEDKKDWVIIYHDQAKNENKRIIFNPSEKLVSAIKRNNPRVVFEG